MTANMMAILPYLVLAGGALLVMLVDSFVKSMRKDHLSNLSLLVLLGAQTTETCGIRTQTILSRNSIRNNIQVNCSMVYLLPASSRFT